MLKSGINLDRYALRRFNGHPSHSYVDVFYKDVTINNTKEKRIFTRSFTRDFSIVSKNVIITTNNPLISKEIINKHGCYKERQWITVPKHLSEVLMMDMVVLMNTYCNLQNKHQYWDVYYFVPPPTPSSVFRAHMQGSDSDDEEDLSSRP